MKFTVNCPKCRKQFAVLNLTNSKSQVHTLPTICASCGHTFTNKEIEAATAKQFESLAANIERDLLKKLL